MNELGLSSRKLKESFEQVHKHNVSLHKGSEADALINFKATKDQYIRKNFLSAMKDFKDKLENLDSSSDAMKIKSLVSDVKGSDLDRIKRVLNKIDSLAQDLKTPQRVLNIKPVSLPDAITSEVEADIKEMEACFQNDLYRSAIILCGRIIETVLHRKYYETVGVDLLEKSPGIGLGKIIAKLLEKEVELDPGLTQQIHLINQMRIFTVHKKQKAFYPSKAQAHAMILYTMDVLEKLF